IGRKPACLELASQDTPRMDRNHCCSSVIIYNFHLIGIAVPEAKANPPRPVDGHRPLTSSVALGWMQPHALERAVLIQLFDGVQGCQQVQGRIGIESAKSGLTGLK